MSNTTGWKAFFFPDVTRAYIVRVFLVTVMALAIFGYVLTPFRIHGHSMAPTYRDGQFNFCNKLKYRFSPPQRQDVVALRMAGERIVLLKRVVAQEGDVVAFRAGTLFVNNRPVDEPYVHNPAAWELAPRKVVRGHVYVVGDNRRVPMHVHQFGQTSVDRIMGGPMW